LVIGVLGSEMKTLGNLEIYRLSLGLSETEWQIYQNLPKTFRFDIGSQLLRAVDSIGANIAEGYGRFHYKESMKFYYNVRGSLWESKHWILLLYRRDFIEKELYLALLEKIEILGKKLNNCIGRLKHAQ